MIEFSKSLLQLNIILSNFGVFILYNLILLALFCGVYIEIGDLYLSELFYYYISFFISFFVFYFLLFKNKSLISKKLSNKKKIIISHNLKKRTSYFLILTVLIGTVIHYLDIGYIPIIKAIFSNDYYEIAEIRKQANLLTTTPIRYLSSFLIKSIIPFLLIYLMVIKNYKLYSLIYLIAILYAFSLMQKSFILTILLPSIFYAIYLKRIKFLVKHLIVICLFIFGLLNITNPQVSEMKKNDNVSIKKFEKTNSNFSETTNPIIIFLKLIKKRVILTPGKIVAKWFVNIPNNEPFLNGCGYRILAPILGCDYRNYGQELYDDIFPKYAAIGIKGNVNTTSFMYDYANFGILGLIISGLLMGALISIIDFIFSFNIMVKFAVNSFYILMLSSSALTTLMFSGGWGLMILLFFIYKKDLLITNNKNENLPSNISS